MHGTHPYKREVSDAEADLTILERRRHGDGEVLVRGLPRLLALDELGVVRPGVDDVAQHLRHVDLGTGAVRCVAVAAARPESDRNGDLLRTGESQLQGFCEQ